MADPRDVARQLREQVQAAEAALEDAERQWCNMRRLAEELGRPDLAAQARRHEEEGIAPLRRVRDGLRDLADGLEQAERAREVAAAGGAAAQAGGGETPDELELERVMIELAEVEHRQILRVERMLLHLGQLVEVPAAAIDGFHRAKRRAVAALTWWRRKGPTS